MLKLSVVRGIGGLRPSSLSVTFWLGAFKKIPLRPRRSGEAYGTAREKKEILVQKKGCQMLSVGIGNENAAPIRRLHLPSS